MTRVQHTPEHARVRYEIAHANIESKAKAKDLDPLADLVHER